MSAILPVPGPIPEKVSEPTFTNALRLCLSCTRSGAEQGALRGLVARSLAGATSDTGSLNKRWVEDASWNFNPVGSLSPDVIASEDQDILALVMEAKAPESNTNIASTAMLRQHTAKTAARLAATGEQLGQRSAQISEAALISDPRWDAGHVWGSCDATCTYWHTRKDKSGLYRAGVHQGDCYTSQIAYLGDGIRLPDGGLDAVDFIALLPTATNAYKWGRGLISKSRWHLASLRSLLCALEAGRVDLPNDQQAWLDRLLGIAHALYGPTEDLGTQAQLIEGYERGCAA